ncbi:PREDICTED: CASP-like protein 5C1 isoform X1 [Nelumbo nucifera]|uniref:CASP-like protein n=1 Tax=Nelumbo nucifera TaxID=4432 RepID=A0A1U8Q5M6_NELNU|nr:PREDICTED: CASP-like protein 5C1 isoform X1 [Nelumbo nucifera]
MTSYLGLSVQAPACLCDWDSFLVTAMGLVIPWSFTLAMVDGYAVIMGFPFRQPGILLVIIVGDWVLSLLSLAAACAANGVISFLLDRGGVYNLPNIGGRYQLSVAMAFFSWFLSAVSLLFNLWLLPSL